MLFKYPGYRDCHSFCNLDLTLLPEGTAFVVCAEHPDNPGTSVTNRAEIIATKVCRDNAAIDPLRLTWIEHYPAWGSRLNPKPPTWSIVTFDYDAPTRTLRNPRWRYTSRQEIEQLHSDLLTPQPLQDPS